MNQTPPVIAPGHNFGTVTDKISAIVLTRKTPIGWWFGFAIAFGLANVLLMSLAYLVAEGVGIWGINHPVAWGFAIVNFVWWIGIGHAGTLISAILLLFKQTWRTSINRFAEAMTLFAVACAGLFPIAHLGRPWLAYWLFPYPNSMNVWPQFRSPLVWDVFAVSTYATVSLLFWFVGLIPDLATLRDRSESKAGRVIYGALAMGWRGSAHHWHRYEMAYLLLAGLATPLVVSVHTIVSFDFAISVIPGWHATIFPPYFVAGAIYSGFAMVLTLAIPIRSVYGLQDFITERHLNNMAKILLVTGLIVAYGYMIEAFMAWYSANTYEIYMMRNRMTGPYGPAYWALLFCNVLTPQFLWMKTHSNECRAAVHHLAHCQRRHVARAIRHRRHVAPPRFSSFVVGPVHADDVGLGDVHRHDRSFPRAVVPVPAVPPDDLDLRDANVGPGCETGGWAMKPSGRPVIYGLMAEFENSHSLVEAARRSHHEGYRRMDAYSPIPIEELHDALHMHDNRLPKIVLAGGIFGGLAGYGLQYWASTMGYPLNVGGRPLHSWPAFIPVTFETTILAAALSAVLGMLALNGLPQPFHPVFNVPRFALASRNRFFLCIEADDPKFNIESTRRFLESLGAREVTVVEN